MAQVRLLVPWTDDKGKNHAAGDVINVDDDTFTQLRADGKASATAEEDAAAKQAGTYTARTGRSDVEGGAGNASDPPKPKDDDAPKPKAKDKS
jgi:hypothetical protein